TNVFPVSRPLVLEHHRSGYATLHSDAVDIRNVAIVLQPNDPILSARGLFSEMVCRDRPQRSLCFRFSAQSTTRPDRNDDWTSRRRSGSSVYRALSFRRTRSSEQSAADA